MSYSRIKNVLDHLSREQHVALLAKPNWRRTRQLDKNFWHDSAKIPRATLRHKASERIRLMAKPKHVTKKHDPELIIGTKKYVDRDTAMRMRLQDLLRKVQTTRYQKYRFFCNAKRQRDVDKKMIIMAKLHRVLRTSEDWQEHEKTLERIAAPKKIPKPKPLRTREKWKPFDSKRLDLLSTPVRPKKPKLRDPFLVSPKALAYEASDRIKTIAMPRLIPSFELRIPGQVSAAAKNATITERISELAKPLSRPPGMEIDLKEDAFTVSPAALKVKAWPRLKRLAKPKTYGRKKK